MSTFDHGAPVPLAEVFATNTVCEHCLDLWEIGSSDGILVHEHPAGLVGVITVVSPALTGSDAEEFFDNRLVSRPGEGVGPILGRRSTAPFPDRGDAFRIEPGQERDQLVNFSRCGGSFSHRFQ